MISLPVLSRVRICVQRILGSIDVERIGAGLTDCVDEVAMLGWEEEKGTVLRPPDIARLLKRLWPRRTTREDTPRAELFAQPIRFW
jgi:hypothetical protein